jgi:hypothetical protein
MIFRMAANRGETREITSVTIAGRDIPAAKAFCPDCVAAGQVNLDSDYITDDPLQWIARCTKGHIWTFRPTDD